MRVVDAAAKEAAVAQFLREHPQLERAACQHPALLGCDDTGDEHQVLLLGRDGDHPERAWCRAAFAAHAPALRALLADESLPGGLISADDRERLLDGVAP